MKMIAIISFLSFFYAAPSSIASRDATWPSKNLETAYLFQADVPHSPKNNQQFSRFFNFQPKYAENFDNFEKELTALLRTKDFGDFPATLRIN